MGQQATIKHRWVKQTDSIYIKAESHPEITKIQSIFSKVFPLVKEEVCNG